MNGSAKPATRDRYPSMPSAITLISAAEDELMAGILADPATDCSMHRLIRLTGRADCHEMPGIKVFVG